MKNKRRKKNVTVHFFPEHFSFVFPIQCIRFLRWSSSLRFSKVYFVSGTVDYLLLPYRIIIFFFINDRKECKHNRNRIRTVFIVSCFRIVVRVLAMIRLGLSFFSLLRSMSACVFLLLSSSSLGIMCIEEIGKICVRTTVEWREQKKNKPDTYMTPIVWSVLRRILNISKFWCWSNVQTFKAFCHAYRKNVPYKMTFFIVWRLIFSSLYFWSCHGFFFCIFFFHYSLYSLTLI